MKKFIVVFIVMISISLMLSGCTSQKVFIGYKVSTITEIKGQDAVNQTYITELYYDGNILAKDIGTVEPYHTLITQSNFSPSKDGIYLYIPPNATYTLSSPHLHIYTLPYYNGKGLGSGIVPIQGGAIASYDMDYVEIYKGDQKLLQTHIPIPTGENSDIPFILTGVEKDGNIYMLWGYSKYITGKKKYDTYVELANITNHKVLWQKTIPNCVVSCTDQHYIDNHIHTYVLCPQENGTSTSSSTTYISLDTDSLSIKLDNQEPKWEQNLYIHNIHITVKGGILYINDKEADKINSEYGFYMLTTP